jgi:hypothetical protein
MQPKPLQLVIHIKINPITHLSPRHTGDKHPLGRKAGLLIVILVFDIGSFGDVKDANVAERRLGELKRGTGIRVAGEHEELAVGQRVHLRLGRILGLVLIILILELRERDDVLGLVLGVLLIRDVVLEKTGVAARRGLVALWVFALVSFFLVKESMNLVLETYTLLVGGRLEENPKSLAILRGT